MGFPCSRRRIEQLMLSAALSQDLPQSAARLIRP
jgi:hypothetical protein